MKKRVIFLFLLSFKTETIANPIDLKKDLPVYSFEELNSLPPLAGQGFKTFIDNTLVEVPPDDRRAVNAWDLGLQFNGELDDNSKVLPEFSLYFWRALQSEESLFYAQTAIIYNNVKYAKRLLKDPASTLDFALTLNSLTLPEFQSEMSGGRMVEESKTRWGYLQPGIGLGQRKNLNPEAADQIYYLYLILEPSYLFVQDYNKQINEMRTHIIFRYDKMNRNLIGLPHQGYVFGGDYIEGSRLNSGKTWGTLASDFNSAERYNLSSLYAIGASIIPYLGPQYRFIAGAYGGSGKNLDRFSAFRIGGGIHGPAEDFTSSEIAFVPGTMIQELFTDKYRIIYLEFRKQLTFFAHLGLNYTLAQFNTPINYISHFAFEQMNTNGIGISLTTGFVFDTRLSLNLNRNNSILRNGEQGSTELLTSVSGSF